MLDHPTREALAEALDDEFKARATYRAVIARHGPVRPFVNIVEAEGRHIEALLVLYRRHGLTPPDDRWTGRVEAPDDLADACAAGVQAELDNEAMYDRLLAEVDDPEVLAVMQRLQEASAERHLPAFQRCLERERLGGGRHRRDGRHHGRHHGGPR